MLTTDGEALAAIGRDAGVEVVIRDPPISPSDTATVDAAARHALESLRPGPTRPTRW